jgi:peptidoglycan-associated lipoprotein
MQAGSRFVLPMLGVSLLLAAGCAHEKATHPAESAFSNRAPAPVASAAPAYGGSDVSVAGDIVSRCSIVVDNVERAPKFAFDESALTPQDRSVLDQVATCVTTGPLRGHGLKLVGRADARGEVEYNFVLGEHRSGSVQTYLAQRGMDASKIIDTSRGKLDATGTDEDGWARDRRVDIDLQ